MDYKLKGLLIGCVGAVLTLSAYSQNVVSDTNCIVIGLCVLMFGLLVNEGVIPL